MIVKPIHPNRELSCAGLLAIHQLIRKEAAQIISGEILFSFCAAAGIPNFLTIIGHARDEIRNIAIMPGLDDWNIKLFDQVIVCSDLGRIYLHSPVAAAIGVEAARSQRSQKSMNEVGDLFEEIQSYSSSGIQKPGLPSDECVYSNSSK